MNMGKSNKIQISLWNNFQRKQLDQLLSPIHTASPLERTYYLRMMNFIAREHLIKRAAHDTGWAMENITISDEAIRHIIQNYTCEEGVRELQRELTAMLRRALLKNNGEDAPTDFTITKIDDLLSVHKSAGFNKKIGFGVRL